MTQIHYALETILPKCPDIDDLLVPVKGQQNPVPLVRHVKNVLSGLLKEAETLLEKHGQLSGKWWTRLWKGLKFALDKEIIASMLESVEQAHTHLHTALVLANLNTFSSW